MVGIGYSALAANTSGTYNVAVGQQSLASNTTASENTAVGFGALLSNTGANNTALGSTALYANTTATANTAVGLGALRFNTTASNNTAVGYQALYANTTGTAVTAVGYRAAYSNTTGSSVAAFGYQAGNATTTSNSSTYIGTNSGLFTTGQQNTFLGQGSGESITTGSKNTIIGRYDGNIGGLDIRTSSNYIVLSDGDGNPRLSIKQDGEMVFNKVAFNYTSAGGYYAFGTFNSAGTTDYLNCYNTSAGAYRFYVSNAGTVFATSTSISAISDQRLKENVRDIDTGLDAILALKPRRFDWKEGKGQDKKDVAGFIAQEFETVFPECVSISKAGEDGIEYKNINHETLIPTLVKAIQELKAEIDILKGQA
jgi:hypothetical protein